MFCKFATVCTSFLRTWRRLVAKFEQPSVYTVKPLALRVIIPSERYTYSRRLSFHGSTVCSVYCISASRRRRACVKQFAVRSVLSTCHGRSVYLCIAIRVAHGDLWSTSRLIIDVIQYANLQLSTNLKFALVIYIRNTYLRGRFTVFITVSSL